MFATWKIVTNPNERKILVVNGVLSEEYKKELHLKDYEAIFIESFFEQASQDYQAIFFDSSFIGEKCRIEALFCNG